MKTEQIHKLVYDYPTKHKEGLTNTEVEQLLTKYFYNLDGEQYRRNLGVITVMIHPEDGVLTYHNDVFYGIVNTLAGRDLSFECD